MKHFAILLLSFAMMTSCIKGTDILFSSITMGFWQKDGTFKADDGNIYNFTEYYCSGSYTSQERILVECQALEKRTDGTNFYNAAMVNFAMPLYKDPLTESEIKSWEAVNNAPVNVTNVWIGGQCLNLYSTLQYGGSGITHLINLILDESRSNADTLDFVLCHDKNGDSETYNTSGFYSSFPLNRLATKNTRVVGVRWNWDGKENSIYGQY